MRVATKRIYEPASKTDGTRMLVDRLWPRGVSKAKARIDIWAKDLAPSGELRKWFHQDVEKRYKEFSKRYKKELISKKKLASDLLRSQKKVTLITSARDIEHSHIPTLASFLSK